MTHPYILLLRAIFTPLVYLRCLFCRHDYAAHSVSADGTAQSAVCNRCFNEITIRLDRYPGMRRNA